MSTPSYSPGISSAGFSAPSSASLPFTKALGAISRHKSYKRGKQLADVIKTLKQAVKAQENALKARAAGFGAMKQWTAITKPDNRDLINQINGISGEWNGDSEFLPKVQTIISRLQELRREEVLKDKAQKEVRDAQKAYYRALYKNYPTSEVETLERTCKTLRQKADNSDAAFQDSVTATLNQCLTIFYHQMYSSASTNMNHSAKVLDMIANYETTSADVHDGSMVYCDTNENGNEEHSGPQSPYQKLASFVSGKKSTLEDIFNKTTTFKSTEDKENNDLKTYDAEEEVLTNPFSNEYGFATNAPSMISASEA